MPLNKENAVFERAPLLTGRTQIDEANRFNVNDFDNTNNIISLKNKTSYWSCRGVGFISRQPDIDDVNYEIDAGNIELTGAGIWVLAPVNLPNGAIITGAVVYSDVSNESWSLIREELNAGTTGETMATANTNTEDTSISNATIDNSIYGYFLVTSQMDAGDKIYGARITYTTDYD